MDARLSLSPRGFTPSTEAIAQEWFDRPVLPDNWLYDGSAAHLTLSRACPAYASEAREQQGFVKPHPEFFTQTAGDDAHEALFADTEFSREFTKSGHHQAIRQTPIAALEKIAADLAHVLGLPVAPVALQPTPTRQGNDLLYSCVSLQCDGAQSTHGHLHSLTPTERLDYFEAMSRMNVFKAFWGHREQKLDFAMMDHRLPVFFDHSLTHLCPVRNRNPLHPIVIETPIIIRDAVKETSEKIRGLSSDTIRELVYRLPDAYLSQDYKAQISTNLQGRQASLKTLAQMPCHVTRFDTKEQAFSKLTSLHQPMDEVEIVDRRAFEPG